MDLGPHAGFIIASYAVCFGVVLALIAWVRLDKARLDATLQDLSDRGISRSGTKPQKTDKA
ncbi:heme exporter protein CcmD [Roseibium sp.]|uniref:heme exporter protein CcmD n=1 Tax=Roseibium sp. TaxID=1936156 RepID=UPI003A984B22